jgi:putative tricarboxylic transport membrane protein
MVRADFLAGVLLAVLATAVVWGSVTMPQLAERGVHPSGAPGVVPGALGLALALCAVLLVVRSVRAGGHRRGDGGGLAFWLSGGEGRRLAVALALTLMYALVLVGTIPFWLATLVFVFAFVALFERLAELIAATALAAAAAVIVPLVFQSVFLVRLP